jgi:glycosyltransferase involved in cell wall biosynthesis
MIFARVVLKKCIPMNSGKTQIVIDPFCRIEYSAFYIQGLHEVFGKKNVSFSSKYFKQLKRKEESSSWDHYMAFIIKTSKTITKIIIDFRDKTTVKEKAYEWADIYAKINFNRNLTPELFHEKILSIPPGFGYKIWNIYETAYFCVNNYIKCKFSPLVNLRTFLTDYYKQYKRPKIDNLTLTPEEADVTLNKPYIFFNSCLWPHGNCLKKTNKYRKLFVELCQTMGCVFEGGFFTTASHPQREELRRIITYKYNSRSYFKKTKLSAIVFNTPSVHDCHGWKLGEFLAMGKAIISTPLSNELPKDLIHGKNIHYVSNSDELKSAIERLLHDKYYRSTLEEGARRYYEKISQPRAVIKHIIRNNTNKNNVKREPADKRSQ